MKIRGVDVPGAVIFWGVFVLIYGLVWLGYLVWAVTR